MGIVVANCISSVVLFMVQSSFQRERDLGTGVSTWLCCWRTIGKYLDQGMNIFIQYYLLNYFIISPAFVNASLVELTSS